METNQIPKGQYRELQIADIILPENCNPREKEQQGNLFGLRDSFEEIGQLNAITVNLAEGKYYVVAGRRRIEAAKLSGQTVIEAKVYENLDYKTFLLMLALENIHRRDFNAIEQARLMQMMNDNGYNEKNIAAKLSINVDTVRRKMNLLKLSEEVQRMITRENNPLPVHQAGQLVKLSESAQLEIARKAAPITGPVASEQQVKEMVDTLTHKGQKNLNLRGDADEADKHPTLPKPDKKEKKQKTPIDKSLPKTPRPKKEDEGLKLGEVNLDITGDGVLSKDGRSLTFAKTSSFFKVGGKEITADEPMVVTFSSKTTDKIIKVFQQALGGKKSSSDKPAKKKGDDFSCQNPKCKKYKKTVYEGGGFICVDSSTETTGAKWKCIHCKKVFMDNTSSNGRKIKSA